MPYFGDLFIVTALVCATISLGFYVAVWRGKDNLLALSRSFFALSTAAITFAITILLMLILSHDFSVAYVFSYSSTDLPLGYLIASLWGGQEGTFLLWIFLAGLMGMVMMYTAKTFEFGNMVWLNLFQISILLILLVKSPFELMPVFRAEGAGLNPLLQNFWMQIHPPIMFVGFAAVVIPFCFAMTGLVERNYRTWSESARRWTMFAWASLGISLTMGGWWAYETLGWGGFWAWDPVENSSFIPWLFLTAQVHTLFIKRLRRGLLRFSVVVVSLSFLSVLYGTFLTRSGVLADFSVHSFVDLGINNFLIAGLLFFVVLAFSLLLFRWRDISPEPSYATASSRSYLVTLGILVLFLGSVLVLLGTSAPLLTRLAENPSAVGLTYYFNTMTPIAIAVMMLIGLFPAFRWNNGLQRRQLLVIGASAGVVTALVLLLSGFTSEPIYLFFFGAAAWALVSNGWVLIESFFKRPIVWGYVSHIGLALAMIGAGVSAGFENKEVIRLPQGERVNAMGYDMTFTRMVDNAKGFDCHVELTKDGRMVNAVLPHEFPKNAEGVMRKPHIQYYPTHDLYVAPSGLEQPKQQSPGVFHLHKGEQAQLADYTITFHEFEFAGAHGEAGMTSAAAVVSIERDGTTEEVQPLLTVASGTVTPTPVSFDDGRGSVSIAGVRPEDGSVVLQFDGDFIPRVAGAVPILVIELSEKPLIMLFWGGTIIMFFGGLMSMRTRRKRRQMLGVEAEPENETVVSDIKKTPVAS